MPPYRQYIDRHSGLTVSPRRPLPHPSPFEEFRNRGQHQPLFPEGQALHFRIVQSLEYPYPGSEDGFLPYNLFRKDYLQTI